MAEKTTDEMTEDEIEELDGVVRDEDGRLRAKMAINANGGRVPDEYQ